MSDTEQQLKELILHYMYILGIPTHIRGYLFVRYALYLTVLNKELLFHLTTELYPTIANKYETTPNKVERAIRYAIKSCFENKKEDIFSFFPFIHHNKKLPSNAEFLSTITNHICLDLNIF